MADEIVLAVTPDGLYVDTATGEVLDDYRPGSAELQSLVERRQGAKAQADGWTFRYRMLDAVIASEMDGQRVVAGTHTINRVESSYVSETDTEQLIDLLHERYESLGDLPVEDLLPLFALIKAAKGFDHKQLPPELGDLVTRVQRWKTRKPYLRYGVALRELERSRA